MLRSLQVSKTGMLAQEARLEVIANNLANAATTGFKRLIASYEELPAPTTAVPARSPTPAEALAAATGGATPAGALARRPAPRRSDGPALLTRVDLRQGALEQTGNPLDLAVSGDGFFVVRVGSAERYTRAGTFRLDAQGTLVDAQGHPLVGGGGPIQLAPGSVAIASDGTVSVNGAAVDRLRVVRFPDPTHVRPVGDSLLALPDGEAPQDLPPAQAQVAQGFLERSNANPVHELISLIMAQRVFEAGQRLLVTTDDSLSRAINQVGRVR